MTRLLLVVKILPTGTEVDLDKLTNSIKENLGDGIELPICSGCNRHIMPNDKSVKLNCPECGKTLLWRCQSCRESASSYTCDECKFSGP